MNRRAALKQAALIAGGIAWLPSCNFGPERVAVALNNLQIDLDHQDLLAQITEIIIPSGEVPGAEDLDLYQFVLVMVDDCLPKEDQQAFVSGLQKFVPFVEEHFETSFPQKDQQKNEEMLAQMMALDENQAEAMPGLEDVQSFLDLTKGYTIQGFMSSEYIMTKKFPYKLVPGEYQACVSTDGLIVM